MGQKKHRNRERNNRKEEQRRVRVDGENRAHDSALYADGFVATIAKRNKPSPSAENYPYSTASVIDANEKYVKVDPKFIYTRLESTVSRDADDLTPRVEVASVMYANKPEGPVEIGRSKQTYPSKTQAMVKTLKDCPVVALFTDEGEFQYPFYNETKGRLMAEAEAKRERRRRKVMGQLGVMAAIAASSGYGMGGPK
jgi:hypothetical protein